MTRRREQEQRPHRRGDLEGRVSDTGKRLYESLGLDERLGSSSQSAHERSWPSSIWSYFTGTEEQVKEVEGLRTLIIGGVELTYGLVGVPGLTLLPLIGPLGASVAAMYFIGDVITRGVNVITGNGPRGIIGTVRDYRANKKALESGSNSSPF